jgi:hypothetical protein
MIKTRNVLFSAITLCGMILLAGWGTDGHYKINAQAPAFLPNSMLFLKASWTILLADHASDADDRKTWDDSESPRHYLNIDDYPEFVANGKIPMNFDSVVALHGISFVLDKGLLPWATLATYDSLRDCFLRQDWETAVLFAADLGHYVGDGHQPLHLTRNYNGDYSNQKDIHSRFESRMIGKYLDEIVYTPDSVTEVENLTSFVFSYIYYNYKIVDSILYADSVAHAEAGSTWSTKYYTIMWDSLQGSTISLFIRASKSLASLIYTAWVEAGKPVMPASYIEQLASGNSLGLKVMPNPSQGEVMIRFFNHLSSPDYILKIYDSKGKLVTLLSEGHIKAGWNEVRWDGAANDPGMYFIRVENDFCAETARIVLLP